MTLQIIMTQINVHDSNTVIKEDAMEINDTK